MVALYGVFGGYPYVLEKLDTDKTLEKISDKRA